MNSLLSSIEYSHQYISDLAWIIHSLPLLKAAPLATDLHAPRFIRKSTKDPVPASWLTHLNHLNLNPSSLIDYINQRQTSRVGFYYEALVSYLLKTFPKVALIEEHLQLQDRGRTLGEIDFLYRNKDTQELIHLETAVKFYLGSPTWIDQNKPHKHWLGPMIKDRLDLKTDHLINHQTQMCFSEAYKTIALKKGITQPTKREVLMQGYLFLHPKHPVPLPYPNPLKSKQDIQPTWFKFEELEEYLSDRDRFLILKKPYWLGPFHDKINNDFLDKTSLKTELYNLIKTWNRPILVSMIDPAEKRKASKLVHESNRCFIVPNNWAGISSKVLESGFLSN